jgi:hypothetical protein
MRKDLRRSRVPAEKDRRNRQAWGAELRLAPGQAIASVTSSGDRRASVAPLRC